MRHIQKKTPQISASVSCMDLCRLGSQIQEVEQTCVSFFHYDVVDGRFNRCFILGENTLAKMRSVTSLPIEVHLAAYDPERYIEGFAKAGADYISVHYEAMQDPLKTFGLIRKYGCEPVLAYKCTTAPGNDFVTLAKEVPMILKLTVNPGFSGQKIQPQSVEHIRQMRRLLEGAGLTTDIQADGNINLSTIPLVSEAGATILTGGTSGLFTERKSVRENALEMLHAAQASRIMCPEDH